MQLFKTCLGLGLLTLSCAGVALAETPAYRITKTILLGAPDAWDYLYYEPTQHRIYVAHATEVTVVDGKSGDIIGRVRDVAGANGVTAIPALGKGFAGSRAKKAVLAFD